MNLNALSSSSSSSFKIVPFNVNFPLFTQTQLLVPTNHNYPFGNTVSRKLRTFQLKDGFWKSIKSGLRKNNTTQVIDAESADEEDEEPPPQEFEQRMFSSGGDIDVYDVQTLSDKIIPTRSSSQVETTTQEPEIGVIMTKRMKTSDVWNDFDEVEITKGVYKAICKYCKLHLSLKGSTTSHLRRHTDICKLKKVHKQTVNQFKPSNLGNPFITPDVSYSNEKMREIIATSIMVHEYPFSIVEDEVWMWGFEYANPEFCKITSKTARSDCLALYEAEKKKLKSLLMGARKISLTIEMWRSRNQVAEYMVITGHFIDVGWKLQKRVLSVVNVSAPKCEIDVADAIFKCSKAWGIEKKVFSVSVDNAAYDDSRLRNLEGLFHVMCSANILNLFVQNGLNKIKDIIFNIRESVKYVSHNDARLKAFCDIVKQKRLKDRKLIVDCPTRLNSTLLMLSTALKFKTVFTDYKERDPHYDYAPTLEDWKKVDKVCKLLEVFNQATHVISGSEYPTSNLYLAEVWRVKQAIDNASEDEDLFMSEMAASMKKKFDKYWGNCNLLIAIASVLDPRCKFHVVNISFPLIYKPEDVAKENISKVKSLLEELYEEYVSMNSQESSSAGRNNVGNNPTSSTEPQASIITGFDQIMSIVREKEDIPPMKSELQVYLDEELYIPDSDNESFNALDWWRNNSSKYKILSKLAADILAVPVSTVTSETTFSDGGRVSDEFPSRLKEEYIEVLICGGDWLRHKYNLKRKSKVDDTHEEIVLRI